MKKTEQFVWRAKWTGSGDPVEQLVAAKDFKAASSKAVKWGETSGNLEGMELTSIAKEEGMVV